MLAHVVTVVASKLSQTPRISSATARGLLKPCVIMLRKRIRTSICSSADGLLQEECLFATFLQPKVEVRRHAQLMCPPHPKPLARDLDPPVLDNASGLPPDFRTVSSSSPPRPAVMITGTGDHDRIEVFRINWIGMFTIIRNRVDVPLGLCQRVEKATGIRRIQTEQRGRSSRIGQPCGHGAPTSSDAGAFRVHALPPLVSWP